MAKNKYQTSAKIVEDTLILSLPDAVSPVVWRMDFSNIKEAAIEIKEKKNGSYSLVMKMPDGDIKDIAPFDDKDAAMHALMMASDAMGGGFVKPTSKYKGAKTSDDNSKIGQVVAGGAGLIIILIMLFSFANIGPKSVKNTTGEAAQYSPSSNSGHVDTGVPILADDFLRSQ